MKRERTIRREEQEQISAGVRARAERAVTKALANPEVRALMAGNRERARELRKQRTGTTKRATA